MLLLLQLTKDNIMAKGKKPAPSKMPPKAGGKKGC